MSEISDYWIKEIDFRLETPLETSKTGSSQLNNLLFGLETEEGVVGIGEAAPSYFTGETKETAKATLREVGDQLVGKNPLNYRELIIWARERFSSQYSAVTALEIALFDYFAKKNNIALSQLFGGGANVVETDITLPITSIDETKELVQSYLDKGFSEYKIKIGKDLNKDLERIEVVEEVLDEIEIDASIKLDGNQAFRPKEFLRFLDELKEVDVVPELVEQPVPKNDIEGLRFVRDNIDVPVAADESLFSPKDAMTLLRKEAVDVYNIKLMESGILGALDIISIAKASFVDLMMGCMTETQVANKAAAAIVAGTNEFNYVDLDSSKFLKKNLKPINKGPRIGLGQENGHGIYLQDLGGQF